MEFYSLDKDSRYQSKPVRIQWFTDEYSNAEPSEHHYGYETRWLKGIAEDGSQWEMTVDVNQHNDDDWYELDEAVVKHPPGYWKSMQEPKRSLDEIYWDYTGEKNRNREFEEIETQKYFNNILGEYPNIDHTKTEYYKKNKKFNQEPSNRIFQRMGNVPFNKLSDKPGKGVEFLRVPKYGDPTSDSIVKLTDTGIFKNSVEIFLRNIDKEQKDILNLASRELFNGDVPRS